MVAISERNPKRVPALKVKLKDSPVYVGVNKNEPALLEKVNQIRQAISEGRLELDMDALSQAILDMHRR